MMYAGATILMSEWLENSYHLFVWSLFLFIQKGRYEKKKRNNINKPVIYTKCIK